ncbi:Protein SCARECROW [Linum perenne]
MIKGGGYEVVHDMMQTHDPWDYSSAAISNKPAAAIDNDLHRGVVNLERNELSEWVEHVTKQLIDDLPVTESDNHPHLHHDFHHHHHHNQQQQQQHNMLSPPFVDEDHFRPRKVMRRTTLSNDHHEEDYSTSHNISPDSCTNNNEEEEGLRYQTNNPNTSSVALPLSKDDEQSLGLISKLFEIAVAISVENLGEAHEMLLEITHVASPYSSSCAERVVSYFARAMSSRVMNSWLGICTPLTNHKTVHAAFQVFNNVSPFVKFAHFTSNQAILEAFQRRDRVHIIDLDIMQGLQWPALFHILATRVEGPPHVRMTGMGSSMDLLVETGKQLSNFARRLGLSFEFHPIAKKFGEVDVSMVPLRRGETLAVHWMQHSLYDAVGTDWKAMRLLEELAPRVVTLVEQDVSNGAGSFLDRFVGSLHYYSTMFDSLGAFMGTDDPGRHKVEHCLFYREINNVMAIGGPGRSGEEKFKHWRSELGRSSFLQIPMSANSMAQAQLILNMFPTVHGYSLVQGDGTLRLGWKDTSLFTASAWTSPAAST